MAITKDQKTAILDELKQKFGDAKGVVFAQNKGLSVEDAQTLRRGLRESNVDYKVAKKTLIKLAAKEVGYDIPDEVMEGPIAVAFGFDDEIVAAQQISKFAKEFDSLTLMGGFMEGKAIDAEVVKQLASIPSREVLLGQFVGTLMAPLSGFVGIGNGVVGGFVRATEAYRAQREEAEGAPEPEPAPEPAKEEPKVEDASAEEEPEAEAKDAPAEEEPKADEAPADDAPTDEPVADEPAETEAPEAEKSDAPADDGEAETTDDAPAEEEESKDEPSDA